MQMFFLHLQEVKTLNMKKVLGLDLGSSSIGWAVAAFDEEYNKIVDMGSRIVPLSTDDQTQFSKGQAITKNSDRTAKRTTRKGYDRRQQRKSNLNKVLTSSGIIPVEIIRPIDLWALRSKAVTEQISLNELGRVLIHLNQKRGYRSGKEDFNDSTKSKYVQSLNDNYLELVNNNETIGQHHYKELLKDGSYRVKGIVYPRIAYIQEFEKIMLCQKQFYPDVLNESYIKALKDEVIFYQRKLKSCKHLVSICDFEKREYEKKDGSIIVSGPHVAPKSSPLSELCKQWEFVNTITITNRFGDIKEISVEEKKKIIDYLAFNEKLKLAALQKILGIGKKDGWWIDPSISKRNMGNNTLIKISNALNGKYGHLLRFNIKEEEYVNHETGEVRERISEDFKKEPLFQLWHTLYSVPESGELAKALGKKFGITDDSVLSELIKIDFVKEGYAGKSTTAIRKILPFLMDGMVYSEACEKAGYNHSGYMTKDENESRTLSDHIDTLKKGELRQPIVEKILNQSINVINAINKEYGPFDEIRVELARELKQSKEEREAATKNISKNERENKDLSSKVQEYGFDPTRNRILKMRLWEETGHICIYCGQPVSASEFLSGIDVEKEHIVPRSLLFDNSSSNVTCSCRKCNQDKGNLTACDFMKSKGPVDYENYVNRVNKLYEDKKISKTKLLRLLMPASEIPTDFIERQLRETQYISKKAMELLKGICHNVYATSGSVTDYLRHVWGWDTILHDLHFNDYQTVGLTTIKEVSRNGNTVNKEVIKDWSKRMDHRHHAIDALAIACTSQGIIQQLNTLSTLKDVPGKSFEEQGSDFKERHTKLEKYVLSQPHFSTDEVRKATESILVSFKSGKKVTTPGKRYTYQGGKRQFRQNVLVPRGALSEETVYGKIQHNGKEEVVVKYPISSIDLKKAEKIVDEKIKEIVIDYLNDHNGKYQADSPVKDHQGRDIRSVRILTGLSAVAPVRFDENDKPIGFVKPGNNHHIAIYKGADGKLHENTVSFWHAVERKKYGLPVIIENPQSVYDDLSDNLPEEFISQLPSPDWKFVLSLQQNEMFILGLPEDSYQDALKENDMETISVHLYRVQKIASMDYVFRNHLETTVDDKYNGEKNNLLSQKLGKMRRFNSFDGFFGSNPHKVRINNLGKIVDD